MNPTIEQLTSIHEGVVNVMEAIINKDQEELSQQILLFNSAGRMLAAVPPHIIRILFADGAGKDTAMAAVQALLVGVDDLPKPDVVAMVSEGWMATMTDEQMREREKAGFPPVRTIPGRGECGLCALHTLTKSWVTLMPIEKVDGKRHMARKAFEADSWTELSGRMVLHEQKRR